MRRPELQRKGRTEDIFIKPSGTALNALPEWLPAEADAYLAFAAGGMSLRSVARERGCHASTILRQVRRVKVAREESPLIDEALGALVRKVRAAARKKTGRKSPGQIKPVPSEVSMELQSMPNPAAQPKTPPESRIEREARRILRRLCEKGAFLAVAPDMEKAVVLREVVPGRQTRIAVVDRDVAHAFALQEWIACDKVGKIVCYQITPVGRAALKRLLTEERASREARAGGAEVSSPFQEQHRFFSERRVMARDGSGERTLRFNLAESPLSVLGRKRDKGGAPYLSLELIEAGDRLREDFELAQMGPRITQNWERFLTASSDRDGFDASRGGPEGSPDARIRVARAMEALGPGLSDIVFRVCCFLEGLETAEKRMGWSARSGKIVLKIALERLAMHYRIRPVMPERKAS